MCAVLFPAAAALLPEPAPSRPRRGGRGLARRATGTRTGPGGREPRGPQRADMAAEVKAGDWEYLADVAKRMDKVLDL